MIQENSVHLRTSSILNLPLQTYDKDFSFIVNGEVFQTSKLQAQILSPNICRMHSTDSTIDTFIIKTENRGDFSRFLNLAHFDTNNIPSSEIPFFTEVCEILGNNNIDWPGVNSSADITTENVFSLLSLHERHGFFYDRQLKDDISFISSHFYQLCDDHDDEFFNLSTDTLYQIVNDQLQLNSEDDLLNFVNRMYERDKRFGILYGSVLFKYASSEAMIEFNNTFDTCDMTGEIWSRLSERLEQKVSVFSSPESLWRYKGKKVQMQKEINPIVIEIRQGREFRGILRELWHKSDGKIENEVNFTASSIINSDDRNQPRNIALFDEHNKRFYSGNSPGSWVCLDFKDRRVSPTHYTLRSYNWNPKSIHPRNWSIDGSVDGIIWVEIDNRRECPFLNGGKLSHTFQMSRQNDGQFKYIRVRSTGYDWCGGNHLAFESFELYGKLI